MRIRDIRTQVSSPFSIDKGVHIIMPLPSDFPESPHTIIDPSVRWIPDTSQLPIGGNAALFPPLVSKIRDAVKIWRTDNYKEASETSKALLNWWFRTLHLQKSRMVQWSSFNITLPNAKLSKLSSISMIYDNKWGSTYNNFRKILEPKTTETLWVILHRPSWKNSDSSVVMMCYMQR